MRKKRRRRTSSAYLWTIRDSTNRARLKCGGFTIAGVLGELKEGAAQGGLRGMMPGARVYIPLDVAHQWNLTHRGPMSQVALALARQQGNLAEGQNEGYDAAVVRVNDPKDLTEVRAKITDAGIWEFFDRRRDRSDPARCF